MGNESCYFYESQYAFPLCSYESLGSLLNDYSNLLQVWQFQITSVIIGMLFHIAITILFESNQGHAFNLRKLLTILLAFGLSFIL